MRSRSRPEIIESILRVVASGEGGKMRVMYGAYLSYGQLEEYADFMINQGLVFMEGGSGLYKLTVKGEALLLSTEQPAEGSMEAPVHSTSG